MKIYITLMLVCLGLASSVHSSNLLLLDGGNKYLQVNSTNLLVYDTDHNYLQQIQIGLSINSIAINPSSTKLYAFTPTSLFIIDSGEFIIQNALNLSGQILALRWKEDTAHIVVKSSGRYFYYTLNHDTLSQKYQLTLTLSEKLKQVKICQQRLLIVDGDNLLITNLSSQSTIKFQNSLSAECDENGFIYSLETDGRKVHKYTPELQLVKAKLLEQRMLSMNFRSQVLVLESNSSLMIMDEDLFLLTLESYEGKIALIDGWKILGILYEDRTIEIIDFRSKMEPRILFVGNTTNDTNTTNQTGLGGTLIPPDFGFVAAMVVCIGVILILFLILAVVFCLKRKELSGEIPIQDTEEEMKN